MAKIRYQEISEKSGISIATISRIVNNSTKVNKSTRQKVIETMKTLGYDIESLSQKVQVGSNFFIFNIPNIDNPFYDLIIQGAKATALRNGFNLLLNIDDFSDQESFDSFISFLKKNKIAGLITTNSLSEKQALQIKETLPFVQCSECIQKFDIPFVTVDDVKASKLAINYLISLGKKNIVLINGPSQYKYAKDRLKGYLEALEEAGYEKNPDYILQLEKFDYDMALSIALQILNSNKKPDAIFATSDIFAQAAMNACFRSGLKVPEDISIVGFDNIQFSAMSMPALTTINQPRYQMGLISCDMLVKELKHEPLPMSQMILDTELIIRGTTAAK
jgi:LacI family transcriptional regulator, repressor for deo operon, udp, cdd, tsx, nupC, and nupG